MRFARVGQRTLVTGTDRYHLTPPRLSITSRLAKYAASELVGVSIPCFSIALIEIRYFRLDSRWWEPATEVDTHQDVSLLLANNSPSITAI